MPCNKKRKVKKKSVNPFLSLSLFLLFFLSITPLANAAWWHADAGQGYPINISVKATAMDTNATWILSTNITSLGLTVSSDLNRIVVVRQDTNTQISRVIDLNKSTGDLNIFGRFPVPVAANTDYNGIDTNGLRIYIKDANWHDQNESWPQAFWWASNFEVTADRGSWADNGGDGTWSYASDTQLDGTTGTVKKVVWGSTRETIQLDGFQFVPTTDYNVLISFDTKTSASEANTLLKATGQVGNTCPDADCQRLENSLGITSFRLYSDAANATFGTVAGGTWYHLNWDINTSKNTGRNVNTAATISNSSSVDAYLGLDISGSGTQYAEWDNLRVYKNFKTPALLSLGTELIDYNSLTIRYRDALNGTGVKPDSWIIKGIEYVGNCDTNGLCFINDLTGWTTQQYSITATKTGADTNILMPIFGATQEFDGIGTLTINRTTVTLVNEDDGTALTAADFNGAATKHIINVKMYDINGAFIYDFNASGNYHEIYLPSDDNAFNIEITYNNAGLTEKYKKEINFSLIGDANTKICIAPLQNFYEQIFTSTQERKIIVYLPNSDCYVLAANLRNIYQQGQFTNVYTINKSYKAYTYDSSGIKTFLAWVNGGSEYSHDLDAVEFNQRDLTIIVGYDTLAFQPQINPVTNRYDENILLIYFKSYYQDYTSVNLRIFNPDGNILLYELTEDINANEFTTSWDWNAYAFTDQNMLKIIVLGTKSDGTIKETIEYFNVLGQEYVGTKNATFIAAMVLLLFLFGITVSSIGKTFGWVGLIVCIASIAISAIALPGSFWIPLFQAGLFICFLYILLNGGGTQNYSRGVVR